MQRLVRLTCLAMLLAPGCARVTYYENTHLSHHAIGEQDRSQLVITVARAIERGRIRTFDVRTPADRYRVHPRGEGAPIIDALPLPVLTAAYLALEKPGAEWDRLVPTERGGLVPATSWFELDGSLTVEVGAPRPEPPDTVVSAEELRARFGIGPILQGDRPWRADELRSLGEALGLLGGEELAAVAGLPFYRYAAARDRGHGKNTAALYRRRGEQAQIEIYDECFAHDRRDFYGDVSEPRLPSAGAVLHEIGHALAGAPTVEALRRHRALVSELEGRLEALRRAKDVMEADRLAFALRKGAAQLERERARLKLLRRASPVEEAYLRIRGDKAGPTPYGRTSLGESFADAFSLYRSDPAALRRVYPAVHEWFAAGQHVRTLEASLGHRLSVQLAARAAPPAPAPAPAAPPVPAPVQADAPAAPAAPAGDDRLPPAPPADAPADAPTAAPATLPTPGGGQTGG